MLHGEGGHAVKIHQRFHHHRPSAATPPLPSLSQGATHVRNRCKYHRSYPLAPRRAGLLFLVSVYAALAACTYKVRPQAHCVGLLDLGILVRGDGCAGGGPGDERCGEGIRAAGGHLVWSVTVAVTSPCTPAQRVGLHVQTATRPP